MHEIPALNRKGLREFGLVSGAIVAALFGLLLPWALSVSYPLWPWLVFATLAVWALLAPNSLKAPYRLWMRLGVLLHSITTPLLMAGVFFLIFVPTALVMRLVRRDPLARHFDRAAPSYRVASRKPPRAKLEKPF